MTQFKVRLLKPDVVPVTFRTKYLPHTCGYGSDDNAGTERKKRNGQEKGIEKAERKEMSGARGRGVYNRHGVVYRG